MKVFISSQRLETLYKEQMEETIREEDGQRGMEHASVITSNVSDNSIYDVHLSGSAK